MEKVLKVCICCGKEYYPIRESQKYCSRGCINTYTKKGFSKYEKVKCHQCGKMFMPKDNKSKFCSRGCSGENKKKERPVRTCEECGKEYTSIGKGFKAEIQRFCSIECRNVNTLKKKTSFFEESVYQELIKIFSEHKIERQKTFEGLVYKNNLYFDFYIKELNVVIEADGQQHKKDIKFFKANYEDIKNRDIIKNDFCINNNIRIIRIPYKQKINNEYIIKFTHPVVPCSNTGS
jgi:very-short-patch-repair endonuclease